MVPCTVQLLFKSHFRNIDMTISLQLQAQFSILYWLRTFKSIIAVSGLQRFHISYWLCLACVMQKIIGRLNTFLSSLPIPKCFC